MCKRCVLIQPGPFTLSLPDDSPPTASGQLINIKLDDLDGMNEPGPLMCSIYTCKCSKTRHQVYFAGHRRHRDNARADAVRQVKLSQFEAEEKCNKAFTVYLTKWVMEVGVHILSKESVVLLSHGATSRIQSRRPRWSTKLGSDGGLTT